MDEANLIAALRSIVGEGSVDVGASINPDDLHDESLHPPVPVATCVVRPTSHEQVAAIAAACSSAGVPMVARGSGTGLSGAAVPLDGAVVISFSSMRRILEIDLANHVAVVEPGVTLAELDEALRGTGLRYPVHPGERSGSLGGNVATNAGGMRAVRDGVTRHHVLGLRVVLADGTSLDLGGRFVKSSTGYDLVQLLVGSEGTLALVTQVTVKLSVRLPEQVTLLAPFATLDEVSAAIPELVVTGVDPAILEYIDFLTMAGITSAAGLDLAIPPSVADAALAYLVVVLESTSAERLDEDAAAVAEHLSRLGAIDVYSLRERTGVDLIAARERAFYVAKANGATDIIDVVVPRAQVAPYLARVAEIAARHQTFITGCGHAGDGNVHLSVFEADEAARRALLLELFEAGIELGGAISGEHGIGVAKLDAYRALTDPARLALEERLKFAFDPQGLLNPGRSSRGTTP
jgi:glycolate oxidase